MSIRNAILNATDREYLSVDVTIKGKVHTVWMCTPTGRERDAFESSCLKEIGVGKRKKRQHSLDDIRAKLVACCACEGDGNPARVFTTADVEALTKINGLILDKLFEGASKVSGMTEDDVEELSKS